MIACREYKPRVHARSISDWIAFAVLGSLLALNLFHIALAALARDCVIVEMSFTFSFWPEGNGTKVTFDCTCEGKGLGRLMEGMMARSVEKTDDQRIERLKAAMEARR